MQDDDILFRSFKGIAFISIAPLIGLAASLWFTSDSTAYFLAHLGQIYFSIILFFLCGNIWSFRDIDNSKEEVSIEKLKSTIDQLIIDIQNNMFDISKKHMEENTIHVDTKEDLIEALNNKEGFVTCYTLALPFFAYSLVSTFIFSSIIECILKFNLLRALSTIK